MNVAEADNDYREHNREALKEPYRTVLGHLRHEVGHYYWNRLIWDTEWLLAFARCSATSRPTTVRP